MSTSQRPTFINTKGERNAQEDQLDVPYLMDYYRAISLGHYDWSYNKEVFGEVPEGWIEDCLFCFGNVSAAKYRQPIGWYICNVNATTLDRYGRPYSWICGAPLNSDADRAYLLDEKKEPILDLGVSMQEQIRPFVEIMARCLKVLDMNVIALSQPIAIESAPGEVNGEVQEWDLKCGKRFVPVISKSAIGASVLDLKAQDHTQNLASTIMFLHSRIMDLLCMPNSNLKSSGVSDVETGNANTGTSVYSDWGLRRRRQWCDTMNKLHPELQLSVKVSSAWDVPEGSEAEEIEDIEEKEVETDVEQ